MKYKNLVVATHTMVDSCGTGLVIRSGLFQKTALGNYRDLFDDTVLKPRDFVYSPRNSGEYNLTYIRPFIREFARRPDYENYYVVRSSCFQEMIAGSYYQDRMGVLGNLEHGSKEDAKRIFLERFPEDSITRISFETMRRERKWEESKQRWLKLAESMFPEVEVPDPNEWLVKGHQYARNPDFYRP